MGLVFWLEGESFPLVQVVSVVTEMVVGYSYGLLLLATDMEDDALLSLLLGMVDFPVASLFLSLSV